MQQDKAYIDKIKATCFGIPVFVLVTNTAAIEKSEGVYEVCLDDSFDKIALSKELERAAATYENTVLPPFFGEMAKYVDDRSLSMATPGHQAGSFFCRTPAGRYFYEYFG